MPDEPEHEETAWVLPHDTEPPTRHRRLPGDLTPNPYVTVVLAVVGAVTLIVWALS